MSATEIAKKMGGLTRNSVLGKLHRLGLKRPKANCHPLEARRNRPKLRIVRANTNSNAMRVLKSVERGPLKLRAVEIEPFHVEFANLEAQHCRYPYGDNPFTFCGHPKLEGSSYCAPHHALCSDPPWGRRT